MSLRTLIKTIIRSIITISLLTVNAYAMEFIVVGNERLNIATISKDDLRDIYLGKKLFWGDNVKIQSTYECCDCITAKDFIENIVGEDLDNFQRYWRRKLFSGSGIPPKKFENVDELIAFVAKNEGALGIVGKDAKLIARVKMVKVVK